MNCEPSRASSFAGGSSQPRPGVRPIRSRSPRRPPTTGCASRSRRAVTVLGGSSRFRSAHWCSPRAHGAITSRRRRRPRVLLIAGGVGITPMRALFEVIDLPGKDITLVYRVSREQDLVLKHELDEIAERSGARVVYLVGPSTDAANDMSAPALNRIVGNLSDHDVYLCASPRRAARVRASLMDRGFPRQQLHEERFSF